MQARRGIWSAGCTAAALLLLCCSSARAAITNPHVSRGSGNQLVLTYTETTHTEGFQWTLDGSVYQAVAAGPSPGCEVLAAKDGIICSWGGPLPEPSGTVTVTMTTDKYVSPNTQTHITDGGSEGAQEQSFLVLVEGGGIEQPPPPPPKEVPQTKPEDPHKQEKKEAAKKELEFATGMALANCSAAGAGALLAAGGLVSGPFIAAGLPATAVGSTVAGVATPMCALALDKLRRDVEVVNDPPDPNFTQVALPAKPKAAKPASCRKAPRRGRRACTALAKAGAALVNAARRAEAILDAIVTTMDRTSGATAAGDAAGIALQDSAHRVLAGMLATALTAQNRAAATFAKLLRRNHVHVRLTKKQAAKGVERALAQLASAGVPAAEVQKLAAGQLKAQPVDLVKLLATQEPTAELVALADGLTASAETTYLGAAATALHTTAQNARKQLIAAGAHLP